MRIQAVHDPPGNLGSRAFRIESHGFRDGNHIRFAGQFGK